MTSGVYVLSTDNGLYTGESTDFDRRYEEHKKSTKRKIEGTLSRFEVVRQKTGTLEVGDKNDRRLVEQLMMDLFDDDDRKTANDRKSIADKPKSGNSQKLRKILDKLDVC